MADTDCIHVTTIRAMENAIARYNAERKDDPLYSYLVANAEATITQNRNSHRRHCRS